MFNRCEILLWAGLGRALSVSLRRLASCLPSPRLPKYIHMNKTIYIYIYIYIYTHTHMYIYIYIYIHTCIHIHIHIHIYMCIHIHIYMCVYIYIYIYIYISLSISLSLSIYIYIHIPSSRRLASRRVVPHIALSWRCGVPGVSIIISINTSLLVSKCNI